MKNALLYTVNYHKYDRDYGMVAKENIVMSHHLQGEPYKLRYI
jgi:hypothetical protein